MPSKPYFYTLRGQKTRVETAENTKKPPPRGEELVVEISTAAEKHHPQEKP
jgi:hypothetical protein